MNGLGVLRDNDGIYRDLPCLALTADRITARRTTSAAASRIDA